MKIISIYSNPVDEITIHLNCSGMSMRDAINRLYDLIESDLAPLAEAHTPPPGDQAPDAPTAGDVVSFRDAEYVVEANVVDIQPARRRRAAAETKAADPAPAVETPPADPAPARRRRGQTADAAPTISDVDLVRAVSQAGTVLSTADINDLLAEFKVAQLGDIPQADRKEFLAMLDEWVKDAAKAAG